MVYKLKNLYDGTLVEYEPLRGSNTTNPYTGETRIIVRLSDLKIDNHMPYCIYSLTNNKFVDSGLNVSWYREYGVIYCTHLGQAIKYLESWMVVL